MKTKAELVKAWIEKAERDLLTATHEISFSDAVTESICFHCQQSTEKFIKAYLVFLGINFTKTHEIGELITKCEKEDSDISKFKDIADRLTDYAVNIRYPEEPMEPSLEDAREALEVTKRIKDFILDKVNINNSSK